MGQYYDDDDDNNKRLIMADTVINVLCIFITTFNHCLGQESRGLFSSCSCAPFAC